MKTIITTTSVVTKNVTLPQVKVCMHLLGAARLDFRVMRDATALVEAGYEVLIIDIDTDHVRPREEMIDGVRLKHIHVPGWYRPSRFKPWFFVKMLQAIIIGTLQVLQADADIYHAHIEKAFPACYFAARLRHKPIIFDAPEITLSDRVLLRWRRVNAFVTFLFASVVPHCEGVITASPLFAEEIRKRYHAADVSVILNVPRYQVVPHSNRLREYLGLGSEVRIALYQGAIQANRGLDILVYAARYLDTNTVIVMMGYGPEDTKEQLTTLIAQEGADNKVKIIPAAPYTELLSWTTSADVGLTVLPPQYSLTIQKCLPNKLFEYLMAGLPVLSSQLDAVAEVIATHQVGRVVSSLAPEDVASAINSMIADAPTLEQMRQNALGVARREFHWENERNKLLGLYQKVLHSQQEK